METEDVLGQAMNTWSQEELDGLIAVYRATLELHRKKFPVQLGFRGTLRDLLATALADYDAVTLASYDQEDAKALRLANAQVARRRFGHWATRCLS